jgi:hypothetical protein
MRLHADNRPFVRRIALGALLVTSVTVGCVAATGVLSSAPAAAASTTHTARLEGNLGGAVEPEAKGKFYCNSLTESWALSITGVQVIGADGVTPWDTGHVLGYNPDPGHYYLYVEVGPPNGDIFVVTLAQDPKTGLYEANTSDSVGSTFGCGKGTIVRVGGGTATELQTSQGSLVLDAPLS